MRRPMASRRVPVPVPVFVSVAIVVLLVPGHAVLAIAARRHDGPAIVPREVLVSVTPAADVAVVARAAGASSLRALAWRPDVLVLHVAEGQEVDGARRLAHLAGVRWAAPDYVARAFT